tara:strand:- start:11038 stop:11577 length:540 start_codon:yes stop_codon:yes gene_type:complete
MDKKIETRLSQFSKARQEAAKEAQRLEENLCYSSKGHYAAARFWDNTHLYTGLSIVILSAFAGVSIFNKEEWIAVAGIISFIITGLSSILTFINPKDRAATHLSVGNKYNTLMNKIRILKNVELFQIESDEIFIEELKFLTTQKDDLNQSSPQLQRFAYKKAKKGIESGESTFTVDIEK